MSSKYIVARDAFGRGELRWSDGNVLAQLVSSDYRFNEADKSINDIPIVGDPVPLRGTRFQDGWARADEMLFEQVRGDEVSAIVFCAANGMLIEYHDAIANFPMVPNGGNVTVDVLEPGIFRI